MIRLIVGIILICAGQWLTSIWSTALHDLNAFRIARGNMQGDNPAIWWMNESPYYRRIAGLMPIDVTQVDSKEKALKAHALNGRRLRTYKYISIGMVIAGIGMALSSRWRLEPRGGGYGSPGAGSPSPHR